MQLFGITDRGCVRAENQDSYRFTQAEDLSWSVAVLCDGMGGVHGGRTASELAVSLFIQAAVEELEAGTEDSLPALVRSAADAANKAVYERSLSDPACGGMGTTLVAVVIRNGEAAIANIGDSRSYWLRNGRIRQVTRDHSLVRDLLDRGVITEAEALNHPRRNIITRAVGLENKVKCDVFLPQLQEEDQLILCSDGLSNMLSQAEILETVLRYETLEEAGEALLEQALERGAPDNVTIVLMNC